MAMTTGLKKTTTSPSRNNGFPTQQLLILSLVRICEPIAFMSIFPYVYYMIESFKITSNQSQIAVYAGLVTSSFAFAEFSTGVLWGRLSDRIGRKPVLLGGLAGTAVSMVMFGFATNLPMALIARALGGLLNGNIGVLQTTVAELITNKKEHQPRAYSIMPFVWGLGSILGPALGGALAQPCLHYPTHFKSGSIFDTFPFLLPNLVCTVILGIGITIGILFLEETHPEKRHHLDHGLQIGQTILRILRFESRHDDSGYGAAVQSLKGKQAEAGMYLFDEELLNEQDPPPAYRTNENTPRTSEVLERDEAEDTTKQPGSGAKRAFNKQIVMIIITYGLLAYHAISFDQLMPIFLSSPISQDDASLPFQFTGGFALSSKTIGVMLSIQALYSMACQIFLFPAVVKRFGPLRVFRFTVFVWPILYAIVPYLVLLPQHLQLPGAMVCLLWRITAQTMSFPSVMMLLANSAPSTLVLGLINGVAASVASLSRAFGPTFSGMLHAWGLSMGYNGIAFWAAGLVCTIGAIESMLIKDLSSQDTVAEPIEKDTESGLTGAPIVDAALLAYNKSSDNLLALADTEV